MSLLTAGYQARPTKPKPPHPRAASLSSILHPQSSILNRSLFDVPQSAQPFSKLGFLIRTINRLVRGNLDCCFVRTVLPGRSLYSFEHFDQCSSVHISSERTSERSERSRTNISKIRIRTEHRVMANVTTPRDEDSVSRMSSGGRVRRHDHIAVTRPLVVDEFVSARNHHQIRKLICPSTAKRFVASSDALEHFSVVFD